MTVSIISSALNSLSISVTLSYFKIHGFIYILFLTRIEKKYSHAYAAENIHRDTIVFEATHGKFLLMCETKQQHFTTGATTTYPSGTPEFTPRFYFDV
jgi:hypothetical protein